ncbi:MAG: DoxX family membrane protein [Leptospiraceae bacterium]|nr:DoxX family membrane protein [Leptospiraceae bacterium]
MKKENITFPEVRLELGIRLAISLVFLLFGFNKFYVFLPTPPMQPQAAKFIGALVDTGYLWYLIGFTEILGGILLVLPKYKGWGMILLSPVVMNILFYLLILQSGIGAPPILMSLFLGGGMVYLGYQNWNLFAPISQSFPNFK